MVKVVKLLPRILPNGILYTWNTIYLEGTLYVALYHKGRASVIEKTNQRRRRRLRLMDYNIVNKYKDYLYLFIQ